jgi:DNA-directed RNA polymerase specialized sigma24 family protein
LAFFESWTSLEGKEVKVAYGAQRLATEEIRRLPESLSDDQREVMLLRIVGGFTLEETPEVGAKESAR